MMYFMWTHVGAVIMLAGLLSSYWITGSFEISALSGVVGSPFAGWIAIAILIGFFTKMAVFGLHIWLPYAHAEAPTPISALLSPAMIGIGAYAAMRLVIIPMPEVFSHFKLAFSLWGLLTMVYGGLMALAQDDIKRLLAYSSVSQMGYIFLGLSSATSYGLSGAIFHYVSHGLDVKMGDLLGPLHRSARAFHGDAGHRNHLHRHDRDHLGLLPLDHMAHLLRPPPGAPEGG